MPRTSLLVVLGIALCSAHAQQPPADNKGLCLLQQRKVNTKIAPLEQEPDDAEPRLHGEMLKGNEAALAVALPVNLPEDEPSEAKKAALFASLPEDSPQEADPPAHGGGEGETLQEKEAALAELAEAEGTPEVVEEAAQVLGELSAGEPVGEEQLLDLEAAVVTEHQSQETLANNGALLTEDDVADLDGQRLEEGGSGDDSPFFEGDILPSGPEQLALLQDLSRAQANGTLKRWVGAGRPWTGGRVPYCFAPDVSQKVKNIFRAAVGVVEDNLRCLTFVEVGHVKGSSSSPERWQANFNPAEEAECAEKPAVFVRSNPNYGCFSALGMVPNWKSQALQLKDPGCTHMGVTIHEIGHALGMHHEHQRLDRDASITVNLDNVKPESRQWFKKASTVYTGQPYDILSIMHYGAFSFAMDHRRPTITTKSGGHANVGGRGSLSELDAEQLAAMYKPENAACQANPRTGAGCESTGSGCTATTTCSQAARRNCCSCGGGLQVQCYADKPCIPFALLAGEEAPYLGWIAGGGTMGGWWFGTVTDGLARCEAMNGCRGITLSVPAARATVGKHWMMLKSHFRLGGGDNAGWTSFKLRPPPTPAPATPAATPAPTPPPAAHASSTRFSPTFRGNGMLLQAGQYIAAGGELYGGWKHVTISEARSTCESDPECQGFTWKGGPTPPADSPVSVLFTNRKRHFEGSGWNSYIKAD